MAAAREVQTRPQSAGDVTFTDVSSLPPTYENARGRPRIRRVRFIFPASCGILSRREVARAPGIMAVVGAGKDQFVHNNARQTRDARAFASKETVAVSRCTEY